MSITYRGKYTFLCEICEDHKRTADGFHFIVVAGKKAKTCTECFEVIKADRDLLKRRTYMVPVEFYVEAIDSVDAERIVKRLAGLDRVKHIMRSANANYLGANDDV